MGVFLRSMIMPQKKKPKKKTIIFIKCNKIRNRNITKGQILMEVCGQDTSSNAFAKNVSFLEWNFQLLVVRFMLPGVGQN